MKRQRLGENTGGTTQVTGTEFILFAPVYNGCNVVLSIEISYDKMMKNL